MYTHQLVSIFCQIDDFCKELDKYMQPHALPGPMSKKRGPECSLAISEIMTLLVMFQMIRFRNFKTFYEAFVTNYWCAEFPDLPSYPRFITLMKRAIVPMILFTYLRSGKRTGIYYVDSSCLPVCHLNRSTRHKVFDALADYGHTSVGWFFGLKLHLVINHQGELIAFKISRGNRSDIKACETLFNSLQGFIFGDKGYICKALFEKLFAQGLKLITRYRKNMKDKLTLNEYEKQLLNQRNLIETVIGHLKHYYQVWHTRHRSIFNAITHLVSALAAYAIEPLKLSAIRFIAQNP